MTEVEQLKKAIAHMEGVSFVLGKAHAGMFEILKADDCDLRERLQWLFDSITEDVNKLYYPVNPHNPDTHS